MIRMLMIGYCLGIRSERRLCEEVKLELAYRWFCRLSIEDPVPDHSTFLKNRHGRFREAEALRFVFELGACTAVSMPGWWAVKASRWMPAWSKPMPAASVIMATMTSGAAAPGCASIWMVEEKGIEPHVPVWEKAERKDGTFSRSDFTYDAAADRYTYPADKPLKQYWKTFSSPRTGIGKD